MTEQIRAWELVPGDLLHPVAFEVLTVHVDPPGRAGRQVHITVEVMGERSLPINQMVTVQAPREI